MANKVRQLTLMLCASLLGAGLCFAAGEMESAADGTKENRLAGVGHAQPDAGVLAGGVADAFVAEHPDVTIELIEGQRRRHPVGG